MENNPKSKEEIEKVVEKIHKEIQPALYEYNPRSIESYGESEDELNERILEITMLIRDKYPELYKYIEEMPVTIPDEKNAEVTLKNLKAYYDSLNTVLNKYRSEIPKNKV